MASSHTTAHPELKSHTPEDMMASTRNTSDMTKPSGKLSEVCGERPSDKDPETTSFT